MEDEDDAGGCAVLVANGSGAVLDGVFGSVAADERGVICQADDLSEAENLGNRILRLLASNFVDDVEDRLHIFALCLGECPAGESLGHVVHEYDLALGTS